MSGKYTIWEQTPLKWHKFMTYVALPVSILLDLSSLAGRITEVQNFIGSSLLWIACLDVLFVVASIVLCVFAFIGNLARNRRWFGPVCLISTYALNAVYGLFAAIIGFVFKVDDATISSAIGQIITGVIFAVINLVYYRKRRDIFYPYRTVDIRYHSSQQDIDECEDDCGTEETEADNDYSDDTSEKEEFSSSLDLLSHLQDEVDQNNSNHPSTCAAERNDRFKIPFIVSLAACLAAIILCVVFGFKIGSLKTQLVQNDLTEEYNQLNDKYVALFNENLYWRNHAVLITESGGRYHTFGCQYIKGHTYIVVDVSLAKELGRSKCSACDAPE